METTVQKSYRLRPKTLDQIAALSEHFHGLTPPRVVALAVERLHQETIEKPQPKRRKHGHAPAN